MATKSQKRNAGHLRAAGGQRLRLFPIAEDYCIKYVIANQWCSAQRIKIIMTASGSHTLIHAHWCGNPRNTLRTIGKRTGAGAPRLPCVKGAVMAVSRKAMTEGLSK